MLGLESEEHDRIAFDAGGFKAKRDRELYRLASAAIIKVRTTGTLQSHRRDKGANPATEYLSARLEGSAASAGLAACAFGGDLAHLAAEAGTVHHRLLGNADQVADRPVKR